MAFSSPGNPRPRIVSPRHPFDAHTEKPASPTRQQDFGQEALVVELARGNTVAVVCKLLGITDSTHFRWHKEYGGMKSDEAQRLKKLKVEAVRLKRLLADAELDKAIPKEPAHS